MPLPRQGFISSPQLRPAFSQLRQAAIQGRAIVYPGTFSSYVSCRTQETRRLVKLEHLLKLLADIPCLLNLNISPPVAIPRSRSAILTSGGVSSTYWQYLYLNIVEWRGQCFQREPDCLVRWRGFATSSLFRLQLDDRQFARNPGPPTRV